MPVTYRTKVLPKAEQKQLGRKAKAGCIKSRNKLITSNLRLAAKMASKYYTRNGDIDDLLQDAVFGLCKAAEKFDPNKGAFSTIATNWVRATLSRTIHDYQGNIRLPSHMWETISKLKTAERELAKQKLYGQPLEVLIAHLLSTNRLKRYKLISDDDQSQIEAWKAKILPALALVHGESSLDASISDGSTLLQGDLLIANRQDDGDSVMAMDLKRHAERLYRQTTNCSRKYVIAKTFGLDGEPMLGHKPSDIAKELNISQQRVSQILEDIYAEMRKLLEGYEDYFAE